MDLFDTHTHFDEPAFDLDRVDCARAAFKHCVRRIMLVGYCGKHFERLRDVADELRKASRCGYGLPKVHVAYGLHPGFIQEHTQTDLSKLKLYLSCADALGEIGLDRYTPELAQPKMFSKQLEFFRAQLELAQESQKPVLLHIRKAHSEALQEIKDSRFDCGGIAHSFSGGEQEAKAFVDLGFKLGITTQITNPNAKKLRRAAQAVGAQNLVIETDSPDMIPYCLHVAGGENRNEPKHLCSALVSLAEVLDMDLCLLADTLWRNSLQSLQIDLNPKLAKQSVAS